ncbi:MAG: hypothetical protein LUQ31_01490 [Methanoregula sp.]|nr:hypothetical protein [Methanoregula sp.]
MSDMIEERLQGIENQIRRLNQEMEKLNRMTKPEELSRVMAEYGKKETQK